MDGAAQQIYNSHDLTSMPHPGLGDWSSRGETCFCPYGALVERADRDRRVDRAALNQSSVAHLKAELWPETYFCRYEALVERADRDRRVDRAAPNESSGAHLRAELWAETYFCLDVHQKCQGRMHGFCGALDDHLCTH